MKPHVKATIALPFATAAIVLLFWIFITNPGLFIWPTLAISFIGFLGSIWYALYVSFGGKV
jgi:hypothetical protein